MTITNSTCSQSHVIKYWHFVTPLLIYECKRESSVRDIITVNIRWLLWLSIHCYIAVTIAMLSLTVTYCMSSWLRIYVLIILSSNVLKLMIHVNNTKKHNLKNEIKLNVQFPTLQLKAMNSSIALVLAVCRSTYCRVPHAHMWHKFESSALCFLPHVLLQWLTTNIWPITEPAGVFAEMKTLFAYFLFLLTQYDC